MNAGKFRYSILLLTAIIAFGTFGRIICQEFGVIIVAIKKLSGEMIFNPMPLETLEAGDVIVLIGKKDDLKRMNEIL